MWATPGTGQRFHSERIVADARADAVNCSPRSCPSTARRDSRRRTPLSATRGYELDQLSPVPKHPAAPRCPNWEPPSANLRRTGVTVLLRHSGGRSQRGRLSSVLKSGSSLDRVVGRDPRERTHELGEIVSLVAHWPLRELGLALLRRVAGSFADGVPAAESFSNTASSVPDGAGTTRDTALYCIACIRHSGTGPFDPCARSSSGSESMSSNSTYVTSPCSHGPFTLFQVHCVMIAPFVYASATVPLIRYGKRSSRIA